MDGGAGIKAYNSCTLERVVTHTPTHITQHNTFLVLSRDVPPYHVTLFSPCSVASQPYKLIPKTKAMLRPTMDVSATACEPRPAAPLLPPPPPEVELPLRFPLPLPSSTVPLALCSLTVYTSTPSVLHWSEGSVVALAVNRMSAHYTPSSAHVLPLPVLQFQKHQNPGETWKTGDNSRCKDQPRRRPPSPPGYSPSAPPSRAS